MFTDILVVVAISLVLGAGYAVLEHFVKKKENQ